MVTHKRPISRSQVPLWFLFAVMSLTLLTAIGFLYLGRVLAPGSNLPEAELKILSRAFDRIDQHYIYDLSAERRAELVQAAVQGMVKKLDKYSRYYPPEASEDYNRGTRGIMTGIGVVVQTVQDDPAGEQNGPDGPADPKRRCVVLYPSPGGPAEKAGLRVGDVITHVDGKPVVTSTEAVNAIRGEHGSSTRLTVTRGAAPLELAVPRGAVIIPSVKWARILDADKGIGYLFLEKFTENSATELHHTLNLLDKELREQNPNRTELAGLVLDLRQNPGGLLDTCLAVTNYFLKSGTIVTLKRRNTKDIVHAADPKKCKRGDLALAILLNKSSASASEVFAGALQDHGRARLVGTRSYGKGVVQSVFSWTNHRERLKITTSYYLTPNGRNIENTLRPENERGKGGIAPDREAEFTNAADQRRAIRLLRGREVPRVYREEVDELCKTSRYLQVFRPFGVDRDPQLAAALDEVSNLLGGQLIQNPKGK